MFKNWTFASLLGILSLTLSISSGALASTDGTSSLATPSATSAQQKDYSLSWSTSMSGQQSKDDLSSVRNEIALGLTLTFDMNISSWMTMNLTPKIIAQNGYIQSPDAVNPEGSRIEIHNASLDLKPLNIFAASLGSLNQRAYHSNIFMSDRSFPAARMTLKFGDEKGSHVYGFAEAAMPTSTAVSNNNQDLGSTPSLNSLGLGFQSGNEKSTLQLIGFLNAFQFTGLSQDLSTASVLLGNTGINTGGTNYLFLYKYAGYEANFAGQIRLTRSLSWNLFTSGVQNTQAPSDRNLGWIAGTGFKYDLSRNLQIEPKFDYYHIGSDATVAVYNDIALNTNREGYRTELRFHYNNKVQFYVQYGQRVPVVLNPSQPSETWYLMGVETENAKF